METGTFWSRVGAWLKPTRVFGEDGEWPRLDRDGGLRPLDGGPPTPLSAAPVKFGELEPRSQRPSYWPGRRNEALLQKLQEGYVQVSGLIESVHRHLQSQDARSAEISQSLAKLATAMAQMPDVSKRQAETLASIAAQMQTTSQRARQIEDMLPRLADAHREVVTVLGAKIDSGRAIDERMVASLNDFRGAVTSLGQASEATASTLKLMEVSAARRDEHLSAVVGQHNRRFLMLFGVTVLSAAAAIAVGVVALLR